MKPFAVAVAALVLAYELALVVSTISHGVAAFGPVYTVSQLRAGLADNPGAWLGQIVLVRGVALGPACPPNASCVFALPALVDPDATGPGSYLPLSLGPANPLLALLRLRPLARNGTLRYEAALCDAASVAMSGSGPLPIWHGPAWHVLPVKLLPRTTMPLARPVPGTMMPQLARPVPY